MSEREPRDPLDPLPADQLAAVSVLWGRTGRELRVRFTGSSMAPALSSGTEVRLVCGSGGAVGEVVAVRAGGTVIVHRVVARSATGAWILTRGDARLLPDVPAGDQAVVGRISGRRVPGGFEDVPRAAGSLAQRAALAPLVALLRLSPRAGTAVIAVLVGLRRLLFIGVGALRPWRRPA